MRDTTSVGTASRCAPGGRNGVSESDASTLYDKNVRLVVKLHESDYDRTIEASMCLTISRNRFRLRDVISFRDVATKAAVFSLISIEINL